MQNMGVYLSKKPISELPVCPGLHPSQPGIELCPLGIVHPPNGHEFALGCSLCRATPDY